MKEISIAEALTFKRRALAQEYGVGKLTVVPCQTGVPSLMVVQCPRICGKGGKMVNAHRSDRLYIWISVCEASLSSANACLPWVLPFSRLAASGPTC